MSRPSWLWNRKLRNLDNLLMGSNSGDDFSIFDGEETVNYEEATLITSLAGTVPEVHLPVIDLDIEHHYEPSSTSGHGHLFLNVSLTRDQMTELVSVLARLGIIEAGFANSYSERGYTAVRKPGIVKPRV